MGKIIRDRVPETLHPHYPDMQTRLVSDLQEHILLLVQKIIEEYSEFSSACNMPQKREEAADVFEVLDTLFHLGTCQKVNSSIHLGKLITFRAYFIRECIDAGFNLEEIINIQRLKRNEKGGFDHGIVWINP